MQENQEMENPDKTTTEPAWLTRVRDEQKELAEKIAKLEHFLNTRIDSPTLHLSYAHIILLRQQLAAMKKYDNTLCVRIALSEAEMP